MGDPAAYQPEAGLTMCQQCDLAADPHTKASANGRTTAHRPPGLRSYGQSAPARTFECAHQGLQLTDRSTPIERFLCAGSAAA
jgi:hypothetical protein